MMKKILLVFYLFYATNTLAYDTIRSAIDSSLSAIKAQRERIKIVSQNIANENSTAITPGGDPPRRKTIAFKEKYNPNTRSKQIKIIKYGVDESDFKVMYDPSHPASDEKGLVKYPNIDRNIELRDIMEAERSIEANMSVIETSKQINKNLLEIIQ